MSAVLPKPRLVELATLKPHPRNYRVHPEDQLLHLEQSIREHGFYRNIVAAEDLTILAGHGVCLAAARLEIAKVPTIVLPISPDSPPALKILAGDNEVARLAEIDDRGLSELLREISTTDELVGLLGTGYDEMMLANLVFVTRPASEIGQRDGAQAWAGLPSFEGGVASLRIVVHLESEVDRERFMRAINATIVNKKSGGTWSLWYPERERQDLASLRFDEPPPDA